MSSTAMTSIGSEHQHIHQCSQELPSEPLYSYLRNPGEEPQWVQMGELCPVCGHIASSVAMRMHLEAIMGFARTEEEAEVPDYLLE